MEKYEKDNLIMEVVEKVYKNNVLTDKDRRKYLEYCVCAYNIYEQLCFSGIFYEEIDDLDIRDYIGYAMHVEWLNMHRDSFEKVSYDELDSVIKKQYFVVFDNLVDIVRKNGDKYLVDSVEDYDLFDYESAERKILGLPEIKNNDRKFLNICEKNRVYIKIG